MENLERKRMSSQSESKIYDSLDAEDDSLSRQGDFLIHFQTSRESAEELLNNVRSAENSLQCLASNLDESSRTNTQLFQSSCTSSLETVSTDKMKLDYFCDWYPCLFGIDEDQIPVLVEEIWYETEEDEMMQQMFLGEENEGLEETTKLKQPQYGRRAREKPKLKRKDCSTFDCICDIDDNFERHYVPHFGGGVAEEGREWRVPHFAYTLIYMQEESDDEFCQSLEKESKKPTKQQEGVRRPKILFAGKSLSGIAKMKVELMKSLPRMDWREIRRYRLPYSQALVLELEEDGYVQTAHYFKELLILELEVESRRKCPGRVLRANKNKIDKLLNVLKEVERRRRKGVIHKEVSLLCCLAKYFRSSHHDWWWIAEQIYKKAVKAATTCKYDFGKSEAVCRYLFGTFLLDNMHKINRAQEQLSKARELSLGKGWNCTKIMGYYQGPIYVECGSYLCRALLAASVEVREKGETNAINLLREAYKLSQSLIPRQYDIEIEILYEEGRTFQTLKKLDWAKAAFKKCIIVAKSQNYVKRICDGYLETALCYRSQGVSRECLRSLDLYMSTAERNEETTLVAFGHRYLGEYYLNEGGLDKAAQHLDQSFQMFFEQQNKPERKTKDVETWNLDEQSLNDDVELTRVLTGIAKGAIMTQPICELILKFPTKRNKDACLKLLNWKISRTPFEIEDRESQRLMAELETDEQEDETKDEEEIKEVEETGLDTEEYGEYEEDVKLEDSKTSLGDP